MTPDAESEEQGLAEDTASAAGAPPAEQPSATNLAAIKDALASAKIEGALA